MATIDEIDSQPVTEIRWFAVVSLIGHLGLLALGAVSLWRIADGGWLGFGAAAVFVLLYASMWRFLLAPGSVRRLGIQERWTVTLVVVPLVIVIAALANIWLPAVVAGSFVLLGDALNQRR